MTRKIAKCPKPKKIANDVMPIIIKWIQAKEEKHPNVSYDEKDHEIS